MQFRFVIFNFDPNSRHRSFPCQEKSPLFAGSDTKRQKPQLNENPPDLAEFCDQSSCYLWTGDFSDPETDVLFPRANEPIASFVVLRIMMFCFFFDAKFEAKELGRVQSAQTANSCI